MTEEKQVGKEPNSGKKSYKGFLAILNDGAYEAKRGANIAKRKQNEEAIRKNAKIAVAYSRDATSRVLDEASKAAAWVQEKVTAGVHKVMGSEEYKAKALEVNARLTVALASLEDSIKRRDEEIAHLRARVAELEGRTDD